LNIEKFLDIKNEKITKNLNYNIALLVILKSHIWIEEKKDHLE